MLETIPVDQLTDATLTGEGVFDVLMRANKAHLDQEYKANRIRGPEYSTVYLGALENVLRSSVEFLLQRSQAAMQAALLEQQVLLTQAEIEKAGAEVLLIKQQTANALAEHDLIIQNADKIAAEIRNLDANTALTEAQETKVPKEILHLEAQTSMVDQQIINAIAEHDLVLKNVEKVTADIANISANTSLTTAQEENVPKEGLQIEAQTALIAAQETKIPKEVLQLTAQTSLIDQQTVNAVTENDTMLKQQCKLDAEFDVLQAQKLKVASETGLLNQKNATEKAQVTGMGVDADSVIGRQKALYQAQTDGFKREAEHSAAKLMAETWSVRRTTDEGVQANPTNRLDDASVGRAIQKLLSGVGA